MKIKDNENLKRVTIYGKSVGKYVRSSGLCICHELPFNALGVVSIYQYQQFHKDAYSIISALNMFVRHAQWFN